jgi:hypothetical protein
MTNPDGVEEKRRKREKIRIKKKERRKKKGRGLTGGIGRAALHCGAVCPFVRIPTILFSRAILPTT